MGRQEIINPYSRTTITIPEKIYVTVSEFILATVKREKEITLNALLTEAEEKLFEFMDSNLSWYVLKVKQDLEARKLIKIKRNLDRERTQTITLNKSRALAQGRARSHYF